MSYVRSFPVAFNVTGADKVHKIWSVSLAPSPTVLASPTNLYHHLFNGSLTVELVSIKGSITVPGVAADKTPAIGAADILGEGHGVTSVHDLGTITGIAFAGNRVEFEYRVRDGIDPILKGVKGAGSAPQLVVGVSTDWDSSSKDVAFISGRMEVRFSGEADSSRFKRVLEDLS